MPRDKTESHARVLAAARAEFMEYGYEKASMRRIGERCGMTAAGLYRHCRDKADLFRQIAEPSVQRIEDWIQSHIARSETAMRTDSIDLGQDSEIVMMREIIYPHMEEYRLLLTKAQGTEYENFLHDLVERHQKEMERFLPVIRENGFPVRETDSKHLHLLLSAYVTALFEPVVHGYTLEEALRCLDTVEDFFLPGWNRVLGLKNR